jgi:predicted phosphodiesterase
MIQVDGKEMEMKLHIGKTEEFDVLSCIHKISPSDTNVQFNGKTINIERADVKKILVIGDTGCRITARGAQDCVNDWPFKNILEVAEKHNPDLIIHVGDYYYREKCATDSCKNEYIGDNWKTWEAEFFKPAEKSLKMHPWIFVRGNHENCNRGGKGWVKFLDFTQNCQKHNPDYSFELESKKLRLLVLDSSSKENPIVKSNDAYANTWVLTHVPFEEQELKNLTEDVRLVLSGHEHLLRVLTFNRGAIQAIIGNSGTLLDTKAPDGSILKYGFAILSKAEDGWNLVGYNKNNEVLIEQKISS